MPSHVRAADNVKRPRLAHGALTVAGTDASDRIALRLRAGDPGTLEVDVGDDGSAEFSFDRDRVTSITVAAGAGNDLVRIDDGNGAFTNSIPTTIAGDDGNDVLLGGAGAERLVGGAGVDSIDGNGGNDVALMGSGDDVFIWDPGDGSDVIEGQEGTDTMLFNGAGVAERVALSANGNRLRFLRAPGNVTMDTAGVERVDFNALGGADVVTVDDLHGTDVSAVDLDLGLDGSGDGQDDQVTVNGTAGNDTLDVRGDASRVTVSGGQALVSIVDHEATDRLIVNGLSGNDAISATGLAAGAITLTLEGGTGDDTLAGGAGVETLLGDDGSDSIDGNGGNDVAFMKDRNGRSACSASCATYWPPLMKTGKVTVGLGLKQTLVGVTKRAGGGMQVTYNKHPLYTFALDKSAGQTKGQGSSNFGAKWYAVSARGRAVVKAPTTTTTDTSTTTTNPYPPYP